MNKIGIFLIPKQLLVVLILRLNSFFRCRLEIFLQWYQFYFAVSWLVRSSIAFTLSLFGFNPFSLISCPSHFILLWKNSDFFSLARYSAFSNFLHHFKQFRFEFSFISPRYHSYIDPPCRIPAMCALF